MMSNNLIILNKKMKRKAFTLIELLVVIAIIAILAAVAVVALNNARARARDARRVADIKQIQTALELYYLDNNSYPDVSSATAEGGTCLDSGGFSNGCSGTTYMAIVPTNPSPKTDGNCGDTDYTYTGGPITYEIKYCLGSLTGEIPANTHTATPGGIADP